MAFTDTIRSSLPFASLLVCATLAIPSPQDSSRSRKVPLGPSKDSAIASLERDIPRLMEQATVPGLSAAVVRNGQTYWLHGFGIMNATSSQPVTPDTVFEAASLSKPVFTYAVLKLVDQGKLSLDTPLTAYLSKPYIEGDDRLAKITARLVLSHRTGFPNWRGDGNPPTIRFTPGERFSYSGEGFVYLERAVEQITGKPLNDFMTEAVFRPLGMASSSYVWRSDFDARAATGHDADGQPVEKRKPTEANAASSLHTTARDYALFLSAVLTGTGLEPARSAKWKRHRLPWIRRAPIARTASHGNSRKTCSGDSAGASNAQRKMFRCGTGATTEHSSALSLRSPKAKQPS